MAWKDIGNNLVQDDDGQVVDRYHPLYTKSQGPSAAPGVTGAAVPGAEAPMSGASLAQQAAGASTVSGTPGGAPTGPTANRGTQDVARNSYLALATQSRVPNASDPEIRRPADAFAAAQERGRRDELADAAEAEGPYATGALQGQSRMLRERAATRTGAFEADLMQREMASRRAEIMQALNGLSGFISQDQQQALQRELSQIDADLSRASLGQRANEFSDTLGWNIRQTTDQNDLERLRLLLQYGGA